jgi:hypothetical protein
MRGVFGVVEVVRPPARIEPEAPPRGKGLGDGMHPLRRVANRVLIVPVPHACAMQTCMCACVCSFVYVFVRWCERMTGRAEVACCLLLVATAVARQVKKRKLHVLESCDEAWLT